MKCKRIVIGVLILFFVATFGFTQNASASIEGVWMLDAGEQVVYWVFVDNLFMLITQSGLHSSEGVYACHNGQVALFTVYQNGRRIDTPTGLYAYNATDLGLSAVLQLDTYTMGRFNGLADRALIPQWLDIKDVPEIVKNKIATPLKWDTYTD